MKNVLFILADDHRALDLGCYGNDAILTPHLDKLALAGMVFENAHCQGAMHPAVCVPSRASILTGRNIFESSAEPTGSHYYGRSFAIPDNLPTFPQVLRQRGYETYSVGKWHNDKAAFARSFDGGAALMFDGKSDHTHVPVQPFDASGTYPEDTIFHPGGFSTEVFTDAAISFLEGRSDASRPFCLFLAYTAPHDPRTPPERYRPNAAEIDLPASYSPVHPFDNGDMLTRDEELEAFPRSPDAIKEHLADYYGMIQHLDAEIGRLLERLAELGLEEDTLVIYTADHGIALGNHGLMGKQNLYQHSVRVPLIVAGDQVAAGTRSRQLVWHADLFATLLDLAGGIPGSSDGQSLASVLKDPACTLERQMFGAYRFSQRMARDSRYKLIRYYPSHHYPEDQLTGRIPPTAGSEAVQLFDLENDPDEMVNLAFLPAFGDTLRALDTALHDWQVASGDPLGIGGRS